MMLNCTEIRENSIYCGTVARICVHVWYVCALHSPMALMALVPAV